MKSYITLVLSILCIPVLFFSCDFLTSSGDSSSSDNNSDGGDSVINYAEMYLEEAFDPDSDINFSGSDTTTSVNDDFVLPLVDTINDHIVSLNWSVKTDPDSNLYLGPGGQVSVIREALDQTVVLSVSVKYEIYTETADVSFILKATALGNVNGNTSWDQDGGSLTGNMIGARLAISTAVDSTESVDLTYSDSDGNYTLTAEAGFYYVWHEYTEAPIQEGSYTDDWLMDDFSAEDQFSASIDVTYEATSIFPGKQYGWRTDSSVEIQTGNDITINYYLYGLFNSGSSSI